jgi:hypothetical protein
MRRLRYLLAALVVALVATGCVRSDLTVSVNDDGSGTYSAIVAFNPKAFADLAKTMGETDTGMGDDPCKELRDSANENKADLPTGAKIENYTDGDFCGVKITAPFKAGENPATALEEALGGMSDGADGLAIGLDTFLLEKAGNGWRFEAKPQNSGSGSGSSGADSAMFESFLKGASSIVRIKLPGRVVEKDSNPDAIDGSGTMIWNLNLAGETRTLKARTEPGDPITNKTYTDAGKKLPSIKGAGVAGAGSSGSAGGGDDGGSSTLPLVIGAIVVIAAIVGFVLWRKRKAKGAGAAGGPPPAGPGAPAAMMPTAPAAPAEPAPAWASPAAPSTPTAPTPVVEPTAAMPAPAPVDPTVPAASAAAAGGAGAPGEPQWDPARNAYILWDAGSSKWLQYDNAAGAWKPID